MPYSRDKSATAQFAPPRPSLVGLAPGLVKLASYTPEWESIYQGEEIMLRTALGNRALDIQHIGSTSVPEISAKPIIDIAIAVASDEDIDGCIAPLASVGYEYLGEFGLPGRHFFVKGNPRTHHIHVVRTDSHHWRQWIYFRNYLRRYPDVAREYDNLKRSLAQQYAENREAYLAGKAPFITRVLELALQDDE